MKGKDAMRSSGVIKIEEEKIQTATLVSITKEFQKTFTNWVFENYN
jgi:hypothetical protein